MTMKWWWKRCRSPNKLHCYVPKSTQKTPIFHPIRFNINHTRTYDEYSATGPITGILLSNNGQRKRDEHFIMSPKDIEYAAKESWGIMALCSLYENKTDGVDFGMMGNGISNVEIWLQFAVESLFVCVCGCGVMESECLFTRMCMCMLLSFGEDRMPILRDSNHGQSLLVSSLWHVQ